MQIVPVKLSLGKSVVDGGGSCGKDTARSNGRDHVARHAFVRHGGVAFVSHVRFGYVGDAAVLSISDNLWKCARG